MSPATRLLALAGVLLLFFVSLELMGDAFKLMGRGFAEGLLVTTRSPLMGLLTGLLATSIIQSSSTTSSLTVALVASGMLDVSHAIPIIMGANIGTTVTNVIVSMGHITRPEEFRRAMEGATVHDFFNWLTVLVLFPLELAFQVLSTPAQVLTTAVAGVGGTNLLSPVKMVTEPIADVAIGWMGSIGWIVLVVGLTLLFLSLRYLVVLLKSLVLGRAEGALHGIFDRPLRAMAFGLALTILVQSSSVTTSLIVPLVGAGLLTVRQVYPYTLGANVGTTITALLAALAIAAGTTGVDATTAQAGLTVAFVHVLFNVGGILLFYPVPAMRNLPIRMAILLGDLAYRNRAYAVGFVLCTFYILPLLVELVVQRL
jgi:sodium-dependent phosphate cotransporter